MTVGFLVPRKGSLKVMGALIQAALDRGHAVVLLWDPDEKKPGERVSETELRPWTGARVVRHARGTPLLPVLTGHGVEAVIGTSLHYVLKGAGHAPELPAIRAAGIRLYSVDYALDTIRSEPAGYDVVDVTFYMSDHQRQLHWTAMAEPFARVGDTARLKARSAACGSTMLDQLAVVDRAAVRKRHGLGPAQPVVLFMSLKMAVPDPWRRLVWGAGWRGLRAARALATGHARWVPEILRGHGYRDLVEAASRLARRSGAAFIVKSREKNDDPAFLRRRADVFVYDEAVYPYTSIELMAIADLCIHFQSGAVLEAAFAGVPSLSIAVSQVHIEQYAAFEELYGGRPGTLQNFPGVVWPAAAENAATLLDRSSLADFAVDPKSRDAYIARFLGFGDTRSSHRVLEVVERSAAC
ncbi:MAG TPA: hypothetical protein VGU22_13190 [Methylomirabilota bacterium]|nr:hypothetical protein [Methylomirabilota bacterium]